MNRRGNSSKSLLSALEVLNGSYFFHCSDCCLRDGYTSRLRLQWCFHKHFDWLV